MTSLTLHPSVGPWGGSGRARPLESALRGARWCGRQVQRRWRRWGLALRMLVPVLGLLALTQAVVLWAFDQRVDRQAWQQVGQELQTAERVWRRMAAEEARLLQDGGRQLAADPALALAWRTQDLPALERVLEQADTQHGARLGALLDAGLRVRATRPLDALFMLWLQTASYPQMAVAPRQPLHEMDTVVGALEQVAQQLQGLPGRSGMGLVAGAPFQFVLVPAAPAGWLLLGAPIDQALVQDMKALLAVDMGVVVRQAGGTSVVVATTLDRRHDGALLALEPHAGTLTLAADTHAMRQLALPTHGGEVALVLLRPVSGVVAPYRRLWWALAGLSLLGALLFAGACARLLHRAIRPLDTLDRAASALRQGQFDAPVDTASASPEVARLSRSFVRMRDSLASQQAAMTRMAFEDRLTGLPNRQRLVLAAQGLMARPAQGSHGLALLVLNLHRFKQVNEVLGHASGDELLCEVALRLQRALGRTQAVLARLGGDEFGILLPGADRTLAARWAQRLAQLFGQALVLDDQAVDVHARLGLACWPQDAADADGLVLAACAATRQAKRLGLEVCDYTPALEPQGPAHLSLMSELQTALREGQFRLMFQPKVDVRSQRVVSAEALVRWQHPERGLIPPGEFMPFAEQSGLVRELSVWVLDAAARQSSKWRRHGLDIALAVNLSARDLMNLRLPQQAADILQRHGVLARHMVLEITESAVMDDLSRAQATLAQLARLGFKLSIDDFGTGQSSLAYLCQLPVQELKLDRSFVTGLSHRRDNQVIVRSTIDMAHALGLTVVAEGVEQPEDLAQLAAMGCDMAQGYGISRPLAGDALCAWVTANAPVGPPCP